MQAYLFRLTERLGTALAKQPAAFRRRHSDYLRQCQNPDGGFGGRDPASDLYYTGFALRGLALLGELDPETASRAASHLRNRLGGSATPIDFFSFLYSCALVQMAGGGDVLADAAGDWLARVRDLLTAFRTPDGGFGKGPGAAAGSTYHTFLVILCHQLLDAPLTEPECLERFVRNRVREDGGFVEIAPMRRGGTNPTAAAVGVLQILDCIDPTTRTSVTRFLTQLQSPEGGVFANARAPLCDLLSTFTGCWTLEELGGLDQINHVAALKYVKSLERPEGGFHGGSWDSGFDVEYTFYGLGARALLDPL